jgi:hypothetical protein
MRKHSAISSLERFRGIEREMKTGAFALVADKEEALAKARRNPRVQA